MNAATQSARALLATAIALFALATTLANAALPPGVAPVTSVEGITEYRLDNGLAVLLYPDASKPTTTVNITYKVGSAQESYGETGMAHLLEHMVFKGTPTQGNLMQEFGRRGIDFNGTTYYDRTNYFETFGASDATLEWVLRMDADRMVNSFIAKNDLDTEMTVVRNEFENGENNPRQVLYKRMLAAAYTWHNYGKATIGARSDIENVNIERLQAFYRRYYQPDNAVLIVAGKFDPDRTLALIATVFGAIPKPARVLAPSYTEEPVQDGERVVTVRRPGGSQLMGILYRTFSGAHPDSVALDALADLMTTAPAGRLYKALVEAGKASTVQNWNLELRDPGAVIFWAQLAENGSIEAARATMLATLEGVRSKPIAAEEVDRIRAKAMKQIDELLSDPQGLSIALSESIAQGDWRLFFLQRDLWRKLTAADVERVALEYLKPANRTIGEFIPEAKPDRAPIPPAADASVLLKDYKGEEAVAAGEEFDATPANLDARTQRFALPNGMKVALLPKRSRGETVSLEMELHFGDELSLQGRAPAGSLAASMLMRGARKFSRQQIDDALDRLRARLRITGGETSATASGQTVRSQLADTLQLLAQVLRDPAFPKNEFETLQRQRVTAIEAQRTDPQQLASRTLRRHNNPYPRGDVRYAPTFDEELASLKAMTSDAARDFYKRFFGGSNAELAIVGDFDPVAVRGLLTELFGDWASPSPFVRVPRPFVANRPEALPIEAPDKANAFLIARESIEVNDRSPDYPTLLVVNAILGGSTDSRLLNRLRQKDGLSYSVGSYFQPSPFERNSALGVYAIFAPENLGKVRAGFAEEFERALRDGFTDLEVADARKGVLQERRLSRTEDASVAGALMNQAYLDRTFSDSAKTDAAIEGVDAVAVNAALRKYVKPAEFAWAFAGDFAKAKP